MSEAGTEPLAALRVWSQPLTWRESTDLRHAARKSWHTAQGEGLGE